LAHGFPGEQGSGPLRLGLHHTFFRHWLGLPDRRFFFFRRLEHGSPLLVLRLEARRGSLWPRETLVARSFRTADLLEVVLLVRRRQRLELDRSRLFEPLGPRDDRPGLRRRARPQALSFGRRHMRLARSVFFLRMLGRNLEGTRDLKLRTLGTA